jgi:hypothetical protein
MKFRRQHPLGPYVLDFVCLEAGLVVELDGGQHAEPKAVVYDQRRTCFLESQGFRVVRFWNNDVMSNLEGVLQTLFDSLALTPTRANSSLAPRQGGEGWGEGGNAKHRRTTCAAPLALTPALSRKRERE